MKRSLLRGDDFVMPGNDLHMLLKTKYTVKLVVLNENRSDTKPVL